MAETEGSSNDGAGGEMTAQFSPEQLQLIDQLIVARTASLTQPPATLPISGAQDPSAVATSTLATAVSQPGECSAWR